MQTQSTGQTALHAGRQVNLLDLIGVLAAHWRLLTLAPLIVGMLAFGVATMMAPVYTATTRFLPPQQQGAATVMLQSLGALSSLAGAATGLKNPADQYAAFLKSRSVQDALVKKFGLMKRYEAELHTDALKRLNDWTRVSIGKEGLLSVEVDDEDPAFAANLANGYVRELERLLDRLTITEAQQRRAFFEKQLSQVKTSLVDAEKRLIATGVNLSVLKADPAVAVSPVAQLQAQITAQEVKLSAMRTGLTDTSPLVKQAQAELMALRAQADKLAVTQKTGDDSDPDYVARYRDVKYYETLFELFAKQYELARIDEAREGAVVQVVDIAQPPEKKSRPQRLLIVLVAMVGAAGMLISYIFLRRALGNDDEVKHKLASIRSAMK